jgi:hypothetical protein
MPPDPAPSRWRRPAVLLAWGALVFCVAWWSGRRAAGVPPALTRVYDVRDLPITVPDFTDAPRLGLPRAAAAAPTPAAAPAPPTPDARLDDLARLIRERVAPDTWGRRPYAIGAINGRLVVTHTPDVHGQVRDLLADLRRARDAQVTVEARFLTADDAALAALPDDLRRRLPLTSTAPDRMTDHRPLSDADAAALLALARSSGTASTLTAPRVTVFSGQRAYVLVASQRAYASGATVTAGWPGRFTVTPTIDVADAGVLLDVHATAADDGQSALVTLRPELAEIHAPAPDDPLRSPRAAVTTLQTTLDLRSGRTAVVAGVPRPAADEVTARPTTAPARKTHTLLLVKATVTRPDVDPAAHVFPRPR